MLINNFVLKVPADKYMIYVEKYRIEYTTYEQLFEHYTFF